MARAHYEVLQVHVKADADVIQAAYRRLSKKYHPDVHEGADAGVRMRELNEAYAVLSILEKRLEYDRSRSKEEGASLSSAEIYVSPPVVDLGELEATRARTSVVRISNTGSGLLSGLIVSHVPWIKVSPPEFKANDLDLVVRALPARPGFYWYPNGLEIFSSGGRATVGIRVNVTRQPGYKESELTVYKDRSLKEAVPSEPVTESYYRLSKFWGAVLVVSVLSSSVVWYLISPWLVAVPAFLGGGLTAWRLVGGGMPAMKLSVRTAHPQVLQLLCRYCNARLNNNTNGRCGKCRELVCHVCKKCRCNTTMNKQ